MPWARAGLGAAAEGRRLQKATWGTRSGVRGRRSIPATTLARRGKHFLVRCMSPLMASGGSPRRSNSVVDGAKADILYADGHFARFSG